ncbi:MAG TPA: UpxY family transcription antiterminator [Terriglobia bacterium]|nr:UpxY family transcription antiterminator [Terriglobia bacterium]
MRVKNDETAAGVSTPWYAVYTRHQHEKTVAHGLAGKEFEIFLPLYLAARRWNDRIARISLPLFPGYVFLRGDLERRLDILTTPGVHSLVSSGGQPASIADTEVEAVRRAVEARLPVEPCAFLNCGDRVRVTSGPLADLEGIVVRKKNSCRLVLSVELLEKSIAVEVDGSALERILVQPDRMRNGWKQPGFRIVPASA